MSMKGCIQRKITVKKNLYFFLTLTIMLNKIKKPVRNRTGFVRKN